MSKSKTPLYIKNFGVGKYVSPVKEEEEDKDKVEHASGTKIDD